MSKESDDADRYRRALEQEYAVDTALDAVRILGVIPENLLRPEARGHGPLARLWYGATRPLSK